MARGSHCVPWSVLPLMYDMHIVSYLCLHHLEPVGDSVSEYGLSELLVFSSALPHKQLKNVKDYLSKKFGFD
jgi:hypothetical protein